LGIGAGGFWDAIEAMGGRRLTPASIELFAAEVAPATRELVAAEGAAPGNGR
jgi:hypothetical protein